MDKFKKIFHINKKIFIFLIGLLIISVIFGSILPLFLNETDKIAVTNYLKDFLANIENNKPFELLINGLISNNGYLIILWILGISIIGCIFVIFLFFLKGFILGFTTTSIIINYGLKGTLLSFTYLFPHQIINTTIYGIMTCYSMVFSLKFILFLFKKYDFNIRISFKKHIKLLLITQLILLISVLYESLIWPKLIKIIAQALTL